MKRSLSLSIVLTFCVFLAFFRNAEAQVLSNYCQVPPYVTQNVPPNVMVVMDTSGSMYFHVYFDGLYTTTTSDDNYCDSSGSPCTQFQPDAAHTYPTYKYYGYFDSNYWYTYSAGPDSVNRFAPSAPKTGSGLSGARAKFASEWDGNFLNWLTMRRVDVLKKVLTGGRYETGESGSYVRLVGEEGFDPGWGQVGTYKKITVVASDPYVDTTTITATGQHCIAFNLLTSPWPRADNSAATSTFTVRSGSSCTGGSAVASFNVKVRVRGPNSTTAPLQGVIQGVSTKVRMGLTFYNNASSGISAGRVMVPVGQIVTTAPATGCTSNLCSIVSYINAQAPNSNGTPLADALWTVVGGFAQNTNLLGGPGPLYNAGDFSTSTAGSIVNDPYNYGTNAVPSYPSCSKDFVLFITDGDQTVDANLPASISNYASGKSNFNCSGTTCPAAAPFPAYTDPGGNNIFGMEDVALYMHTVDLRSAITGSQTLTLYPVMVFGTSTLLKYAAINGGFIDSNGNNQPDLQSEWDANGDGVPDTYYEATEGSDMEQSLLGAFSNMISRVSSGTAASVLASGEGSGANLIQASFYPRRRFGNDVISWSGGLQALWYYLDPTFAQTNIFEDTTQNRILNLSNDDVMSFFFNSTTQATMVHRWPYNPTTGTLGTQVNPDIAFESIKNIWDAGKLLWSRNLTTSPRTIYTQTDGSNLMSFSTASAATLAPYLNVTDLNGSGSTTDEAQNLITWLQGNEVIMDLDGDGVNDYRLRTVQIGSSTNVWKLGDILNSTPKIASNTALNPYWSFMNPVTGSCVYCDITYDNDSTYDPSNPPSPPTAYVKSPIYQGGIDHGTTYQTRGAVFVGANDGMLHAFKLGTLQVPTNLKWPDGSAAGTFDKARLVNPDTGNTCASSDTNPCGKELWAFIPKNVLPYLQAMPDPNYCHVYSVDLTPFIVDASINKPISCSSGTNYWDCAKDYTSWRTIVIGGMRLGGACRNLGTACNNDGTTTDCVNTPVNGNGYSSYFALDVTDQNNPKLLWEFTNADLGFTTSGPAVVRIKNSADSTGNPIPGHNGRWFVVFGSGPTGPIDTNLSYDQFLGRSDQNMKLFVLDLKTGTLLRTIDTGIPFAFSGSLFNASHDVNWPNATGAYQDDVVYVPYTKRTANTPYTWTNGGVGNLLTTKKSGLNIRESIDPADWVWRTVIDGVGPVTSGVQNLDDGTDSWLFFGTGRYYFAEGSTLDDQNSQRSLYGIKHPCEVPNTGPPAFLSIDPTCVATVNVAALTDVTNVANAPTSISALASMKGWIINLDAAGNFTYAPDPARNFGAERNITDPLAVTTGLVYFTTTKPYTDQCSLGGKSFIWAVKYLNGAAPDASQLTGKALVQLSTGSIEQKDLKTALTDKGARRTGAMEGEPPSGQGLVVISAPPPVKRILQIKER